MQMSGSIFGSGREVRMIIVHILLWILKIAGILLLLVLGLLLLGILLLLFVPVRYELSAEGDIHTPEEIRVSVSIRYFFRLITFHTVYENQKFWRQVRIAWKKIGQDKEEKQETEEQENPKPEKEISGKMDLEREEKESPEEVRAIRSENKDPEKEDKVRREKPEVKRPVSGEAGKKESKAKEESEKKKETKATVFKRFLEKIKYTFHRICDKIKALSDIKNRVETVIKDEVHQAAFRKGKETVFRLLKAWLPRSGWGRIEYGLDDPYYTGKILAGLALFYPFFGQWLQIVPDFEKTTLRGRVFIRGHIRMNHLAGAAVRLAADKNIRSTAKEVLRLLKRQKKEEV